MDDWQQAVKMFVAGGVLGAIAFGLTQVNDRKLAMTIADSPPEPERPREHVPFGQLDNIIAREAANMARYDSTIPTSRKQATTGTVDPWQVQTSSPARDPNPSSDIVVPLGQALVTATLSALVIGAGAGLGLRLPWGDVARWTGIVWAGVLLLAWFQRLGIVTDLLANVETMIGQDVNGDGVVGRAEHRVLLDPGKARAEVAEQTREAQGVGELADLLSFVDKCYTAGCSETAHGVKPNTAGRETYLRHRDDLLALGIAEWRNENRPTAGWQLRVSQPDAHRIISEHVGEI